MAGRTNGFSHGERPHRTLNQGRGGTALDPPADGPYDGDDPDLDTGEDRDLVDFGAVRVPVPGRGTVTVEPTANGRMQAVHIALPEGRLSMSALAAPKSSVLWPELAKEIATSLRDGGARVRTFTGAWGRELHATTGSATSVFIGVDGPRWMLYGVATGPTTDAVALDAELRRMLCRTVVVRGRSPYPVRTVLPLVAPDDLAPEQVKDPSAPTEVRLVGRAGAPAATPELPGSSAPTDPWRRGGTPARGAPGRAAPARPAEPGPAGSRPDESRPAGSRPAASRPAEPRPATSRPAAAAPDPLSDPLPDPLSDGTPTERWHLIPARPVAPRAPGHLPPAGAGPAELSSPAAGRTRSTPATGTRLTGTGLAGARPAIEPRSGRRRAAEPVEDLPVQPRTGRRRAPEPDGSEPVPVSEILARAAAEAATRPVRRHRAAGPPATGPAAAPGPAAIGPAATGPLATGAVAASGVATSDVATFGVAAAGPAVPRTGRRRAPEREVPELGIPELEIPQPEIPARAVPAWGPPEPEPATAPFEVPSRDAEPPRRSRHCAGSDLPAVEPSPPPRGRHHRPG